MVCPQNPQDALRAFIEASQECWSKRPVPASASEAKPKVLLVPNGMPQATVVTGLVARAFLEVDQASSITLLSKSTKHPEIVRAVFGSFGISRFVRFSRNRLSKPIVWLKSMLSSWRALKMIREKGFQCFIHDFTVYGVHIGDMIYDSLIRYDSTYRDPGADTRKVRSIVTHALWSFHASYALVEKHDIQVTVVGETVYAREDAFTLRIVTARGGKGLFVNQSFAKFYLTYNSTFSDRFKVTREDLAFVASHHPAREELIEQYLVARTAGKLAHPDVKNAYLNKRTWSREELLAYLTERSVGKVDLHGKKICFLMPHCFSDANHKTRHLCHRDFYQWVQEVLVAISQIKNVIWVVKPHPSGHHYNEQGQLEELMQQVTAEHIFMTPPDFNTSSVMACADLAVTVNGTIGLEASCYGVPVILSGEAIYSGFGFTIESPTKADFLAALNNAANTARLEDAQVATAREVLFCNQFASRPKSKFIPKGTIRPGAANEEFTKLYFGYFADMGQGLSRLSSIDDDPYWSSLKDLISRGTGTIRELQPITSIEGY